ncbi:MAG: hypothetical protein JKY42_04355 [Flavobacteriales bacterium]|nr:hypothetical protein [Flavobacteriales bacterium]
MELEKVKTAKGVYWHDSSAKITYAVGKRNTSHKIEDGIESYIAIQKVNNGKVYPLLIDTRETKKIDKACRDYYLSNAYASIYAACAIIVENPVKRLLGNLSVRISRPINPTLFFSNKEKAEEWLTTYNTR